MTTVPAAAILDKGEYLSPTFNPKSLTMPQLTEYLKVFNTEIRNKSSQRERERAQIIQMEAAGPSARISQNLDANIEGGGWENNNVFQLGSLEESPNVGEENGRNNVYQLNSETSFPPRGRGDRKTSNRTSFHKPSSKSPQTSSVPNTSTSVESHAPVQPEILAPVTPHNYFDHWPDLLPKRATIHRAEQNFNGRALLSDENGRTLQSFVPAPMLKKQRRIPIVQQILVICFILAFTGSLVLYQSRSAPIGYCDRGSESNIKLAELQNEACEQQALHEKITYPSSSVLLLPETCTPCPEHASCHLEDVVCDDGYVSKRHPLSFLSKICDGLPFVGPVAFPSKCIEDPLRKKSIGALGERITSVLALERGRRICTNEIEESFEGREVEKWKWGLEIRRLKDDMRKGQALPIVADEFNTLFDEAVQQLLDYGHITKGQDSEGQIFLATEHADMSWSCRISAFVRNTWKEWRNFMIGVLALVISAIYGQSQISAKKLENKLVYELVQLALDTLRNQELSHHTDPITTPVPYISSLQLRDSILEEEHSIAVRTRLWGKVQNIVEGNANVRVNMEDLPGGDELRVWRWVGGVIVGRPRQISPRNADDISQRRK